jgi:hypothetical protein
VSSYFARNIISNNLVFMVTQLFSQYAINAPHVNHQIIALFLRMTKHVITMPEETSNKYSTKPTSRREGSPGRWRIFTTTFAPPSLGALSK